MPTGEGPCFLGSIVLGKYPLGNSTVLLRDLTNLPRGVPACLALSLAENLTAWGGVELSAWRVPSSREEGELPGRAHSLLVKECCLPGKPGNCLPGRSHSLPVKECYLLWKPRNCLPGRCHSLLVKECYLPGKPGNCLPGDCLPGRTHSLLVKECCLPGKSGDCLPGRSHSLPMKECYLLGKAGDCLPGRAHSLLVRECYLLGKPGNCLHGRNGSMEGLFLPGKAERPEGKHWELTCLPDHCYLPACYLTGGSP